MYGLKNVYFSGKDHRSFHIHLPRIHKMLIICYIQLTMVFYITDYGSIVKHAYYAMGYTAHTMTG